VSKLARFRARHGEPKRNPPLATDVVEYMLPGFAAFAASRVATRMVTSQIARRYPSMVKHAGAIAAIGTFAAAWLGAHRVKALAKYHHPIVIGTGLAAAQSLLQLYLPGLSKLIGEPLPTELPAPASRPVATQQIAAEAPVPVGFTPTTASEWYRYNDAYDAGSYKGKVEVPSAQANPPPTPDPEESQISDLLDNSDLQLDNSDLGLFS